MVMLAATAVAADDRDENIDVYVVLDKSLSMVEEIGAVRDYVQKSIIDELLIPGDRLILITFYGQAETRYVGDVDDSKSGPKAAVSAIEADGRFTDIGNALDALKAAIPRTDVEGRRKYMLLITDGQQEAPPDSKYSSTDVAFNHEFLQNAKEIRMEGWKIHILGIGTESAAREIAEELAGTYSEVPEEPTEEELDESTEELLGIIELVGDVSVRSVRGNGATRVSFDVTSSGYDTTQRITVNEVTVETGGTSEMDVLDSPYVIEVAPESTESVDIPLRFPEGLDPGRYEGTLSFYFDGKAAFTPASVPVSFNVKTFLGNNIWIIPAGILVLGLIGLVIYVLASGGGSISFVVEIEDGPVRKRPYKIKYGNVLYVIDGVMGFNILPKAGQTPAAELHADKDGLHLNIVDEKQMSAESSIARNVMGETVEVRKKDGKKARFTFSAG